jgi:hypothetical protein
MPGINRKTVRRCEKCGTTVGAVRRLSYERPKGNINEEEQREYFEGCGVCDACGRELCAYCGDLRGGVCKDCRKKEEEEERWQETDWRNPGEQRADYRSFYRLARLYSVGAISRERLALEWGMEQRRQGIATALRRRP